MMRGIAGVGALRRAGVAAMSSVPVNAPSPSARAKVTITDLGSDTLLTFAGGTVLLVGVTGSGANVIDVNDFLFGS